MGATDEPIIVSDSLDSVLRSLRGPDRRATGGVFGRWEELVGDHLAEHVRPVRIDRGVLLVEVDEPAWATQVTLLSGDLKRRLADEVGVEVTDIHVRVRGSRAR